MEKKFKKFPKKVYNEWGELCENGEVWFVAVDIAYYLSDYVPEFDKYATQLRDQGEEASITERNTIINPMLDDIEKHFGTETKDIVKDLILWEEWK